MNTSIRGSMYRAVSLLIVIPVLLLSLILSYIYAIKLESVIVESLHAVANAQIAEMDGLCQQQKSNLEIIGGMDASREALRGELDAVSLEYLNNMLFSRVQITNYLRSISLIDAEDRVVACSDRTYEPLAQAGSVCLRDGMEGQPFWISDILTVRSNGEEHRAVAAIHRVEDDAGLLGYVLAEIDLTFYDEIRQRAKLWNESTFYLLDGKGEIIIAGTPEENRDMFVTTEEERKDYNRKYNAIDFAANPQGSFEYKVNGSDYITYYAPTAYTNWRVMLSVNMDNYMHQRLNYGVTAGVLVMFCAVLALWVARFTSKRIVRPIEYITDTLNGIQKGQDYSLRVKVPSNDELGTLSVGINRLLQLIETENIYQAKQQRQLQEKADRDALTKVLNRAKIMQLLQEAIDRRRDSGGKAAALFVDVDDFKDFNTRYGHGVGDQVLLFIAAMLGRETGGTVGRMGGDEFLVVIESPEHLQSLDSILERINQVAAEQFVMRGEGKRLPIAVCIGAARVDFSRPGSEQVTAEQLAALADSAMYQAKNNGKRGYIIRDMASCPGEGTGDGQ